MVARAGVVMAVVAAVTEEAVVAATQVVAVVMRVAAIGDLVPAAGKIGAMALAILLVATPSTLGAPAAAAVAVEIAVVATSTVVPRASSPALPGIGPRLPARQHPRPLTLLFR